MNTRIVFAAVALVAIALTGIACQKAQKEEPQAMVEAEEWVLPDSLIAQQVWLYFTDKPEEDFEKAISDLDAGNTKLAGRDLRTAAAYLKIEAERGRGESKKALKGIIHELEQSADRIEDGVVLHSGEIENMFARAHYALAKHHYERAAAEWNKKDEVKAGEELDVAATHVQHAIGWMASEPDETRTSALAGIREKAGEMSEGKLMPPESVNKTMMDLGRQITDLEMKLGQPQSSGAGGTSGS
jgi:hypothetical protein